MSVEPGELRALDWPRRGALKQTTAWSLATEDLKKARVAERQMKAARRVLDLDEEHVSYVRAASTGTAAFICARYESAVLGASELGERGRPAEKVGRRCARAMRELLRAEACLDEHMADQILPYMALAGEESRVTVAAITDHCRTNVWVLENFLPARFELDEQDRTIACRPG